MSNIARTAPVEARRTATLSLTTWRSRNSSHLVGGLSENTPELTETQRFEAALYASRNLWDIERRARPGFVPDRRITKAEADAKLRKLMAQMIGGGR
jgi:hypothetical protein